MSKIKELNSSKSEEKIRFLLFDLILINTPHVYS